MYLTWKSIFPLRETILDKLFDSFRNLFTIMFYISTMIIQKKKGTETSFDFKESFLHYKIKDTTGTRTLKIHYTNIEIQYIDEFVEQNEWLRNVGILWVCLGLFFIITSGKPDIWLFI